MLQSMGSQRVRHDLETEQKQQKTGIGNTFGSHKQYKNDETPLKGGTLYPEFSDLKVSTGAEKMKLDHCHTVHKNQVKMD